MKNQNKHIKLKKHIKPLAQTNQATAILPIEIWDLIISNINNPKTLYSAALVCKLWYDLAKPHFKKFQHVMKCGLYHFFLRSRNDNYIAWGHNRYSQLMLGKKAPNMVNTPKRVYLKNYGIHDVKDIYPAGMHTYVLTKSGKLFGWGENLFTKLDLTAYDNETDRHKRSELFEKAVSSLQAVQLRAPSVRKINRVYAGEFHTIILTSTKELFAWGKNQYGQLGIGKVSNKQIYTPQLIKLSPAIIRDIKTIKTGKFHTFLLTKSKQLYAWGNNQYNQLGFHSTKNRPTPRKVNLKQFGSTHIRGIYTAGMHTFLLTKSGKVFAWGDNFDAQLGLGEKAGRHIFSPQKMKLKALGIKNIKHVYTSGSHSFLLTRSGELYGWGKNNLGQLGIGKTENVRISCPTAIDLNALNIKDVKKLYLGRESTFLQTKSGIFYAWGLNSSCYLGIGRKKSISVFKPTKLNFK